jgi:hypothetical protein
MGLTLSERHEPEDRPGKRPWWWLDKPPKWWWVLAALVLAVVVTGVVVRVINYWPLGSGDPGGVRLAQLGALKDVLPPGSTVIAAGGQEPAWIGSCRDEYFHKGWTAVVYWAEFRPTAPSDLVVLREVDRAMVRRGWVPTLVSGGNRSWTRVLPSGSKAKVALTPPVSLTPWSLTASATPAAPIGECGGG